MPTAAQALAEALVPPELAARPLVEAWLASRAATRRSVVPSAAAAMAAAGLARAGLPESAVPHRLMVAAARLVMARNLKTEAPDWSAEAAAGFPQAREGTMKPYSLYMLAGSVLSCRGFLTEVAPRPMAAASDSAEYAEFTGPGVLNLQGQALLTTSGGEVRLAAGRLVTLDPATTYARRWFRVSGADVEHFQVPGVNSRFVAARKLAVADVEGRFWFSGLKPGSYLVRSAVTWKGEADSVAQGGVVAALVTLSEEGDRELILHQLYTVDSAAALAIAVVGEAELAGRASRMLGRVSGSSCETEWEEPARKDLVLEAGRKGADAVARVACRKRGFTLSGGGCLGRIVCEGDAVVWM